MTLVALASLAQAQTAPVAPTLPACTILEPTFTIDGKNKTFGTMFAMKVGETPVLVTAHNLFSAPNGFAAQFSADEVAAKVTAVVARDGAVASGPAPECARSAKVLKVADAAAMGGGNDASKDVAVFAVSVATGLDRLEAVAPVPLNALAFSAKVPKIGDTVWLGAPVNGKKGVTWPAKVVEVSPGFLFYQYTDNTLDLAGTTGAPILDATGAVVGLNVGFGKMEDGALIGSASPLTPLKQRVEAAAKP